jgi:hypothetical protein
VWTYWAQNPSKSGPIETQAGDTTAMRQPDRAAARRALAAILDAAATGRFPAG